MSYNKITLINSTPLFTDLPLKKKQAVISLCQIIELKKGDIIYKKGDKPDYFYCMVNGRVELFHSNVKKDTHPKKRIEVIRRGDYFGTISALTGKAHTVSAMALNDSVVLRIGVDNFNKLLGKVPELGMFLSRSLSKRLRRKHLKEIYESKIISVIGLNAGLEPSRYAASLAKSIKKESGKLVTIVTSESIKNKKQAAPKLSRLTADYHFIIVDISGEINDKKNQEILKQSDICYIVAGTSKKSLKKTSAAANKLENKFAKHAKQIISVILIEDNFYGKTTHKEKTKILTRDIFATLPPDKDGYKKTVRRMARELSGVMVGLALGSGAAMGLAHIGVLKVLEKENLPVDIVAGTSMGALIASLWAAGTPVKEIERLALSFNNMLKVFSLIDPTLPFKGLIRGNAVRRLLKPYLGRKTFHDIRFPLRIVACDISRRRKVVIHKGSLLEAVMASIAIPGIFEPVRTDNAQLVDGGVVDPVPVEVLSKYGIKKIIAVNTLPSPGDALHPEKKWLNIYDVIVNSFQSLEFTIAEDSCQQADISLHPMPAHADWYEFNKAELFIKAGKKCTREHLPEIKSLHHA